ncbi:MAG: hypothetical protein AAFQ57_14810, partial [Cyanobacteria bacterium J06626_14]
MGDHPQVSHGFTLTFHSFMVVTAKRLSIDRNSPLWVAVVVAIFLFGLSLFLGAADAADFG